MRRATGIVRYVPLLLMIASGPLMASGPMQLDPGRQDEINRLEQDMTAKLRTGEIKLPGSPGDIQEYARYYKFAQGSSAMAVYARPIPSVNVSMRSDKPGLYLVDTFDGLPMGGNCETMIRVTIRDLEKLDYSVFCGGR